MKKYIYSLFSIVLFNVLNAQVTPRNSNPLPPNTTLPKTRTVRLPNTPSTTNNNSGTRPSKINSTNTVIVKNIGHIQNVEIASKLIPPSNLKRIIKINRDFESNTPSWITQYEDGELNYSCPSNPNWEFNFVWFNIPKNAVSAKIEISDFPFPIHQNADYKNNLETKIILKLAQDSTQFTLNYNEKRNPEDYSAENSVQRIPVKSIKITSNKIKSLSQINSNYRFSKNYGTYYVRLTPLDANNKAIGLGGNTIKIVPEKPIPTFTTNSDDILRSDYEITAIYYTQTHDPEYQFADCQIITGYNENSNSPFWTNEMKENFKNAFPIGKYVCPEPKKEDSWYEKAINTTINVTETIANSSAYAYNETKSYVKGTIANTICGNNEACKTGVEFGFDAAMMYAGIPPSLPNFEEMSKLAKGEIIETLAQQAALQSGVNCDANCVALIEAGYDEMVSKSSNQNLGNGDFIYYKPDPRGQYRLPYVQFEVSRVRNSYQSEPKITSLSVTPKIRKTFTGTKNNQFWSKEISSNLIYQQIDLPVPYLQNIGDKITLLAVLNPKYSYVRKSCEDNIIESIAVSQQVCKGWNTIETNVKPQTSSGYINMYENSKINFEMNSKIKLRDGVNNQFIHHN